MRKTFDMLFLIDTEKSILSGECRIHKTERFIKETRRLRGVDFFLSKIAEGIILNFDKIDAQKSADNRDGSDCYKVETEDKSHVMYVRFGYQIKTDLKIAEKDIIFYKYEDKDGDSLRHNDQRLVNYLKTHKKFNIRFQRARDIVSVKDFNKLYNLSNADQVNFPLLNEDQKKIVNIEDQNVLVQGVAGSGKTNICISKIIFAACRAYAGKVLYTTYSRGLLLDTRNKVDVFKNNLKTFVKAYNEGNVIFVDKNHKRAIENKLGIYFFQEDTEEIMEKINSIIIFLEERVDYLLLEDMYAKYVSKNINFADENYFIKQYVNNIKNHQLAGKLEKINYLSYEVIYKEIFGMITGCYDLLAPKAMLTLNEYTQKRIDSFSSKECEIIHSIAQDYAGHMRRNNLIDNNFIARALLEKTKEIGLYSLAVIDEVQDITEVGLCLMKSIARKLFCVGDALQMINPSYFSFAYLKRLLFEKDIISVAELSNNYRNTKRIVQIIEYLSQLNVNRFGTHSFVLKGESVDSEVKTSTIYVKDKNFIEAVARQKFDNFTVIVSSAKEKEALRKILKKQEILTVSDIKGLERDVVVLYNILSSNKDKWQSLERTVINRKNADENSVYRYYFNLFYVGVSRAKTHLYVAEDKEIPLFEPLFANNFDNLPSYAAIESLEELIAKIEVDEEETELMMVGDCV
ncbi:ATP-dependent helicase, partial [bacterium]|nr:ATP-dependent helicase [bacterium]